MLENLYSALSLIMLSFRHYPRQAFMYVVVTLQAKKDGLCIRALAVITPGNPTGQVIPRSNIEDLIKFSKKNDLAVIADEVYQVNVYNSSMKFDSFKKTIRDMGSDYDDVPLFSLQSISKGYYGNSLSFLV